MEKVILFDGREIRKDVLNTMNGVAGSVSVLRLEEISDFVRENMLRAYKWGYAQGFTNKEKQYEQA